MFWLGESGGMRVRVRVSVGRENEHEFKKERGRRRRGGGGGLSEEKREREEKESRRLPNEIYFRHARGSGSVGLSCCHSHLDALCVSKAGLRCWSAG